MYGGTKGRQVEYLTVYSLTIFTDLDFIFYRGSGFSFDRIKSGKSSDLGPICTWISFKESQ